MTTCALKDTLAPSTGLEPGWIHRGVSGKATKSEEALALSVVLAA